MADMKKPHTGFAYGIISKYGAHEARLGNKPHVGALNGLKKGNANRSGIDDAFHGILRHSRGSEALCAAGKRPLHLQASESLLNCLDVTDRTVGAFDEGDGVTPVCFYHPHYIGQSPENYKRSNFGGGFV